MRIDSQLRVRNTKTNLVWRVVAIESFKDEITGEWETEVLLSTRTTLTSDREARLPLWRFQATLDSGYVLILDDDGNVKKEV